MYELGRNYNLSRSKAKNHLFQATGDFADHPQVINGFSDLMVEVFGEKGKHVRSAVGMGSLPRGITVEIEVTLEVEE